MESPDKLPLDMRESIMMGAFVTEASRLKLPTDAIRRLAHKVLQLADNPEACSLFGLPIGCGKHSVHVLNGSQWFCRACGRSFWGENAQEQAEAHG